MTTKIVPSALASDHAISYLSSHLRDIPDFPKPGILFKDITPLLAEPRAFQLTLDLMSQPFVDGSIDHIVAIEARGFIFGGAMAARLGCGFVPVRKPGKLPADLDEVSYALEYGESTLQMHTDSLKKGDTVLVVDDLLATGGTAAAAASLCLKQGATVAAFVFAVELDFLPGRAKLVEQNGADTVVHSLVHVS